MSTEVRRELPVAGPVASRPAGLGVLGSPRAIPLGLAVASFVCRSCSGRARSLPTRASS